METPATKQIELFIDQKEAYDYNKEVILGLGAHELEEILLKEVEKVK